MKSFSLKILAPVLLPFALTACQSMSLQSQDSVYEQIGGAPKVAEVADNFVNEIGYNRQIFEYFKDSNIDRFREKFIEHLCVHTGGPCTYTGDDMVAVHKGMQISEADFNLTVDLLINAMTDADIPHRLQNKVLRELAPMREDMLYR